MNEVINIRKRPNIWVYMAAGIAIPLAVAVLVVALVSASNGGSSVEPEPMPVQDVVSMLKNDGMNILLVNSRRNNFPVVLENVDIVFEAENLVSTENRVEGIINTFETLDDRDTWLGISQGFDGVAVIRGDELWAVSVDSDLSNSREIAENLADTLNGEVR